MNRQRSGFGLYAAFMVIIVLAMFYITGKISAGSSPSQQKFETAVKDGKVTSAQIVQNKEVRPAPSWYRSRAVTVIRSM